MSSVQEVAAEIREAARALAVAEANWAAALDAEIEAMERYAEAPTAATAGARASAAERVGSRRQRLEIAREDLAALADTLKAFCVGGF